MLVRLGFQTVFDFQSILVNVDPIQLRRISRNRGYQSFSFRTPALLGKREEVALEWMFVFFFDVGRCEVELLPFSWSTIMQLEAKSHLIVLQHYSRTVHLIGMPIAWVTICDEVRL